jgi:hypothetical protein
MSETRKPREKLVRSAPIFMTKADLCHELCLDRKTLDAAVKAGRVPPPHSTPTERKSLWKRKHFLAYELTGSWPDEAFKR